MSKAFLFHLVSAVILSSMVVMVVPSPVQAQDLDKLSPSDITPLKESESSDIKPEATSSQVDATPSQVEGRVEFSANHYLLGPGDILQVQVLDEPDYSQKDILVQPDGNANFLGVGNVMVKDRNVQDVTNELTTQLSRLLIKPQVHLSLMATRPATVYISGAVMHPGMFQIATATNTNSIHISSSDLMLRTDLRLTNVLATAGGVQMDADLANIEITRQSVNNGTEKVTVDLWKLLKNADKTEDVLLQAGDTVNVPQLKNQMALLDEDYLTLLRSPIGPKEIPIRVIGRVKEPGIYKLDGTSPFLNSALASAGGYEIDASQGQIAVRRFATETNFSTMFIDPKKGDFYLRPNDLVYVPENKVYKSGRFMEQVAHHLQPFQSIGAIGSYTAQIFGMGGWNLDKRFGTSKK